MPQRPSTQQQAPAGTGAPVIDLAALGDRLQRFRQWRGLARAVLARQAGVDPMVITRLEGRKKPRLEVETAAKLARVCGWTLDQLCGLAPVPDIPAPRPLYTPQTEGMPAWLQGGLPTSEEARKLGATILAWRIRGAPVAAIAEALTTWGVRPWGGGTWTPATVRGALTFWTRDTKHRERAVLLECGFRTEARQHAAWWRRQR